MLWRNVNRIPNSNCVWCVEAFRRWDMDAVATISQPQACAVLQQRNAATCCYIQKSTGLRLATHRDSLNVLSCVKMMNSTCCTWNMDDHGCFTPFLSPRRARYAWSLAMTASSNAPLLGMFSICTCAKELTSKETLLVVEPSHTSDQLGLIIPIVDQTYRDWNHQH